MEQTLTEKRVDWVIRLSIAAILLQTLWFKFSGAPESIYIFTTMGIEPWGRWGSGVAELIASLLILTPRPGAVVYGAAIGLGVMAGALMSHLTKLGIVVKPPEQLEGDGGLLFILACTVFVGCAWLLWSHRREWPVVGGRFK